MLGESNNSIITGVFILRGPEIKPVVEVAPDWESYEYEKIDYKGDGKAFFDAALAWDLEVGGKKWADGKNVSAFNGRLTLVTYTNDSSSRGWSPGALSFLFYSFTCSHTHVSFLDEINDQDEKKMEVRTLGDK